MADATVIGAHGFVGTALTRHLRAQGRTVATIARGMEIPPVNGDIFFCAGLTSDFRQRPHDAIEAHVTLVSQVLKTTEFVSLTYLSSTRVYQRAADGREDALLQVDPRDPWDIFNLSKLTGEAICLADARPSVRAIRLSNVFGLGDPSDNFLNAVVRDAKRNGHVTIRSGPTAAKDYITLDDAVAAIARVASHAQSRLLNIAGGRRITNRQVGDLIGDLLGVAVAYGDEPGIVFPSISIERMRAELGVDPVAFETAFPAFAATFS